jgi:hypothetical protein
VNLEKWTDASLSQAPHGHNGLNCSQAKPLGSQIPPLATPSPRAQDRTINGWNKTPIGVSMARPKTRFVIEAGQQLSELFSVWERPNGDLMIVPKKVDQLGEGVVDLYDDLKEHRVSVHVSPSSPGITIVQHAYFTNGNLAKSYAFILPKNSRFLWQIYGFSAADLEQNRYKCIPKANDQLKILGSYQPKNSVLIYFVIISTSGTWNKPPFVLNEIKAEFSKFDVTVYWGYIASTSFHQGHIIFPATARTTEYGGTKREYRNSDGFKSLTRGELKHALDYQMEHFINLHQMKLIRFLKSFPEYNNEFEKELSDIRMIMKHPLLDLSIN